MSPGARRAAALVAGTLVWFVGGVWVVVAVENGHALWALGSAAGAVAGAWLSRVGAGRWEIAAIAGLGLAGAAHGAWSAHRELRGERPAPPMEAPTPEEWEIETEGPVRFAVWGDCRGGASVFRRVLASVAARSPDFHVGLGDLVGMARTYQFELLVERLGAVSAPAYLLAGNHDRDPFGTLRPFWTVLGASAWSLRAGPCLVVGVDTSAGVADEGDVAFAEELFADWEGEEDPPAQRILVCHHPLAPPPGRPEKSLPAGGVGDRLRGVARRHSLTVFSGNFHGHADFDAGGFRQVITGGAGSALEGEAPFHYLWVEADRERLSIERVDVAPRDAVSRAGEAWLALRSEAPYAARLARGASYGTALGGTLALGAGLAAILRAVRRRRGAAHSSGAVASST